jgi:NTE family protein
MSAPFLDQTLDRLRLWMRSAPEDAPPPPPAPTRGLVLSGGGARAAYQAGVLRYLAEAFPEAAFPILTGVSAGAINAAFLANATGSLPAATQHLAQSWGTLDLDDVFTMETGVGFWWKLLRQGASPALDAPLPRGEVRRTHGLADTTPLCRYLRARLSADPADGALPGIAANLDAGRLRAVAMLATNYGTGQTVTWVQGRAFEPWERPNRVSRHTRLTIDHIMASTSLPFLFPAVQIDGAWYGDGGIRLAAPLAPAVHLGADRILVISTRYARSAREAAQPATHGYPPAAQILGTLMNAVFLDALDQDAFTLERINTLVRELPHAKRHRMRPIRLLQIRPSVDLGRLAHGFEATLPGPIRTLAAGLGSGETASPDWLSVLLFQRAYTARLLEVGYEDARRRRDALEAFLDDDAPFDADDHALDDYGVEASGGSSKKEKRW